MRIPNPTLHNSRTLATDWMGPRLNFLPAGTVSGAVALWVVG
jgi:hypothetical protein